MASGKSGIETRTDTTVTPRYRQYLAGYLALTVVGTAALLVLARHSSQLMTAVEVLVAGGVLVAASAATIPALYGDAVGLSETEWDPNWKQYVAFVVGTPVLVYFAIAYVTIADVALVVAGVAFVVAAFEAAAMYLYRRYKYVGTLA